MPMYSTYKQYWEAREEALDNAIDVGGQLRDAIGVRDGVGRELKEAEGVAPQERVTELREDYSRKEGRVEELQQEFGDARAKLSAIELDAAGVDPNWASSLEEGIAPDGSRQSDKPGKLDQLKSFIGDVVDAARDGAEAIAGHVNKMIDTAKDGAEAVAEHVGEMVDRAKDGAEKVTQNVKENVSEMVDTVKEGAGEVADHAKELYETAKPTLKKIKDGAELAKDVWDGVEPAVKNVVEAAKTTVAAGAFTVASIATPAASSGDLLQQMENPTAGVQAAVQQEIHEQAELPPGVQPTFVSNLHEAPKGPEGPDYNQEQEDFFEVQNEWDKEEREQDAETAARVPEVAELVSEQVEPEFEVTEAGREPQMAADHPGSLTAYDDPLENPDAVYGELREDMQESPAVQLADHALGEGELNSEPPPPPPPPPPEQEQQKAHGRS